MALMMLRARAMCLIGSGCCIRPLQRFAYLVLVNTDAIVTRVPVAVRSLLLAAMNRSEERHKMHTVGLTANDFFGGTAPWMLQAARMVWMESDAEVWRQGIDPVAIDKWTDDLVRFLRNEGPMPLAVVAEVDEGTLMTIGPIRAGMLVQEPGEDIVFSQEFYSALSGGIGR